ncbi:hypothetical protein [Rubritalea marina]|uniref:hypothetical protein n=1 Tax=Rubritalea marina TaxID=361055 RepID=UPI00036B7AE7|nr:hypothetical protein [Rubritalea marina]
MTRILFLISIVLVSVSSCLEAQISLGVKTNRRQYISYEPIQVTVSIANQSGGPMVLKNSRGAPWVEFVVRNQSGKAISKLREANYSGTTIPTAERVKSSFTLNNTFDLSEPGNYSVHAIVRTPNQGPGEGSRSQSVFFTVNRGVVNWSTKVGVPGVAGDQREYKLLKSSGDGPPKLYVQVEDVRRGHMLACYSLGSVLSFREANKAVDRQNNLHVLFMASPELYCHTVVNTSGKTTQRRYHKSVGTTNPFLYTGNGGQVVVANSQPYDPTKEAEERSKFHKLSEVPNGFSQ